MRRHAPRTYCIGTRCALHTHGVCVSLGSTKAATDNDLLDDVAADGTSLADARAAKAKEGADAKAARAKDATDRASQLKNMKNNTAARTDNDLLDDVAEDGTSLADARNAKAKEGADAKAARAKDAADRAAQLKDMKKNTGARTDNDLLDDVTEDGTSLAEAREAKARDGAAHRANLPM
jgi:uncharacterized protein (DUF4415 family)